MDFLRKTEDFRREMVRKLNEEDAYGIGRDDEGRLQRTTTQDFYTGFDGFRYEPLTLVEQLSGRGMDLVALLAWLVGATIFLGFTARRLDRGGAL